MNMLSAQGNPCATATSMVFLVQLLLLYLLSLFCTGSPQSNPTKCPGSSVAIPYPFRISDNSTPGFDISCKPTGPKLSLGGRLYMVLGISLHQGYVRVTGDTVYSLCQQQNNGPVTTNFIDLEGTPFTFSHTLNKFTVIGCDSMAMIRSRDLGMTMSRYSYRGGCVSFCASEGSITSGACSGVGCCQASVPEELKVLDLELTSIRNQLLQSSGSWGNISRNNSTSGWCSKTFIADQASYVFSRGDLDRNLTNLPMVLDWSISGGSCLEARRAPKTGIRVEEVGSEAGAVVVVVEEDDAEDRPDVPPHHGAGGLGQQQRPAAATTKPPPRSRRRAALEPGVEGGGGPEEV